MKIHDDYYIVGVIDKLASDSDRFQVEMSERRRRKLATIKPNKVGRPF